MRAPRRVVRARRRRPGDSAADADAPLEPAMLIWLLDTAEMTDEQTLGLLLLVAVNGLGVGEALSLDIEHLASTGGLSVVRLPAGGVADRWYHSRRRLQRP